MQNEIAIETESNEEEDRMSRGTPRRSTGSRMTADTTSSKKRRYNWPSRGT